MDAGASFVHYPYDDGNELHKLVTEFKMPTIDANFRKEAGFYAQNKSLFSSADVAAAEVVYQELTDYIWNQGNCCMNIDEPVSNLVSRFWVKKGNNVTVPVKDWVNENMLEEAVDNGADLSVMSSWEWDGAHDGWDYWDYAPVDTMYQLALNIFTKKCSPILHLSEVVTKIDSSGSSIVVTTNKNTYTTSTLFSSLPLGVLQAGTVQFVPPLPSKKVQAINGIGMGTFEKLLVKFSSRFWPSGQSIVSFTGRGVDSKYTEAFVVPGSDTILMFFLASGNAATFYSKSDSEIKSDVEF